MGRNRQWRANDLPVLSLEDPNLRVDIGWLGGEDHRQAFAAVVEKLIHDNWPALEPFSVISIRSKRPIAPEALGLDRLPAPFSEIRTNVHRFALGLYDSRNEKVVLQLASTGADAELGLRFDDPEFWLIGEDLLTGEKGSR